MVRYHNSVYRFNATTLNNPTGPHTVLQRHATQCLTAALCDLLAASRSPVGQHRLNHNRVDTNINTVTLVVLIPARAKDEFDKLRRYAGVRKSGLADGGQRYELNRLICTNRPIVPPIPIHAVKSFELYQIS